ncbi:hypothetical protein I308_105920 [Cryptococcus tetragattii IND107]|uniref:Uncharacterized protein n=1 Tax=Cryptococcus tetragattii IND107 TaxID=1296105 RepID=A0ABR3BNX3_9TREE
MGILIRRPDLELRSELKDGLLAPLHRALRPQLTPILQWELVFVLSERVIDGVLVERDNINVNDSAVLGRKKNNAPVFHINMILDSNHDVWRINLKNNSHKYFQAMPIA